MQHDFHPWARERGCAGQRLCVAQCYRYLIFKIVPLRAGFNRPLPGGNLSRLAIGGRCEKMDTLQRIAFALRDAQDVVTFAKANNWVALISYWSVSLDNGSCQATVSPFCSGVTQGPYDFARIFEAFDSSH